MKAHEYASLFPMMSDAEIESLAQDIKEHGQRDPIITLSGEILDGRNRYRACEIAGMEPWLQAYQGDDPLGFVVSHNLHRRHLTESQRGMIAAKIATLHVGQRPGGNPSIDGYASPTQAQASKLLSVGESTILRARRIQKSGVPELVAAVEQGHVTAYAGETISRLPETEQRDILSQGRGAIKSIASKERKSSGGAPPPIASTNGSKRLPTYKPTDAPEIWQQARITLDRILPNDKHRVRILNEVIAYCETRLNTNT